MDEPATDWHRRSLIRSLAPLAVLIGLVFGYAGYFSLLAVRERDALYQFDEDLAIYDQIVWNTAHGRLFASTLIQHANTLLGDHFSPAVALFAPIYWVLPNADVLLIGQTGLLALMAVPLYLFARPRVREAAALLLAAAYLVYPALHYVNLFQFHEIAMLPLPLAVALLAVERGSRRMFFVSVLVALTVKEEVAIVVVGAGLLWWLRRRDWRTALAAIALGCAVGAITMGVILPHFSLAGHEYYYVRRYAYLGDGPLQMMLTALTSPGLILAHLVTPDRLLFLAELFAPLVLIPILGWEYLVAALPVFGYLLLADSPDQYAIDRHYLSPLLPFLFFGCVLGVERLARIFSPLPLGDGRLALEKAFTRSDSGGEPGRSLLRRIRGTLTPSLSPRKIESNSLERSMGARNTPGAVTNLLACIVVAGCLVGSYWVGPTPLGREYDARAFTATVHTRQIGRLIAEIPSDASVSASRNLLSWFSERERVYRFPEVGGADYVLLDWRDLRYPAVFGQDGGALRNLFNSPDYRLVDTAGATTLFERGDPTAWNGSTQPATQFGDEIELLGDRIRVVPPGRVVEVTFYWRALKRPSKQYTIFVHVLGTDGKVIGQADSWPLDNLYPTDMWQPLRVVPDLHTVNVSQPVPTAGFKVEAGLYDLKTGARLPITGLGMPGGADYVELDLP